MSEDAGGSEDRTRRGGDAGPRSARFSDGIRQGIGVLSAFRDALEETIQEARERGDLSTERAREVMKDALERAQSAAGEARERLDFAPQGDVDALRAAVDSIRSRVEALEVHVFGERRPGSGGGEASGGEAVAEDDHGAGASASGGQSPAGDA